MRWSKGMVVTVRLLSSYTTWLRVVSTPWNTTSYSSPGQNISICARSIGPNSPGAYTWSGLVRPNMPKVDTSPIKPKQWSPCKWDMNTDCIRVKPMRNLLSCTCVPSPQSTIINLPRISTTCDDVWCFKVGNALPHPRMCILNGSITNNNSKRYFVRL